MRAECTALLVSPNPHSSRKPYIAHTDDLNWTAHVQNFHKIYNIYIYIYIYKLRVGARCGASVTGETSTAHAH